VIDSLIDFGVVHVDLSGSWTGVDALGVTAAWNINESELPATK